MTLGTPQGTVY